MISLKRVFDISSEICWTGSVTVLNFFLLQDKEVWKIEKVNSVDSYQQNKYIYIPLSFGLLIRTQKENGNFRRQREIERNNW